MNVTKRMQVRPVGPLGRMRWAAVRAVLRTAGRLSTGVRIGYQHGFDSGTMLDYVYEDKAHGLFGVGRVIDRVYLDAVGWRGIRARRALLGETLTGRIREEPSARVLDVASGPGRYLHDVLQTPGTGQARVLCRDLAQNGLRLGARRAAALDLRNIAYEQGDAFEPAPTDAPLGGRPTVIVVSGLYELMEDETVVRTSMARLGELLEPGGLLIFTTQTHHPQLDFIANVLPNRDGERWVMRCRSVEQVEGWAREAGFSQVSSALEEVGVFAVTTARKPAAAA